GSVPQCAARGEADDGTRAPVDVRVPGRGAGARRRERRQGRVDDVRAPAGAAGLSGYRVDRACDADERSRICAGVLRALPEWFGIEEATAAYIRDVRELELFAVGDIGFLAVKQHNPRAAEVFGCR